MTIKYNSGKVTITLQNQKKFCPEGVTKKNLKHRVYLTGLTGKHQYFFKYAYMCKNSHKFWKSVQLTIEWYV